MTRKRQTKKAENKTTKNTTKTTTPVVETPVVETPVVEVPAVEAPVVEAPAVEKPAKKTTRTTKKEMKTTLFVEYMGKQVAEKDMIAAAKKAWTKSGHKVGDIKTLALYVKPEEASVYYVINDTETGRVEF